MITSEEEFVLVKQNCVAASMTGHRNRQQSIIDSERYIAANDVFDSQARRAIVCMHHSLASEPLRKSIVISNIVAVRQKHGAHASHRVDFLHELRGKPR